MDRPLNPPERHWRKDIILLGNALPAAVNFAAHLMAARTFGLELFGLWAAWRSACQLIAFDPLVGPGTALTLPRLFADGQSGEAARLQVVGVRIVGGGSLALAAIAAVGLAPLFAESWHAPALALLWLGLMWSALTAFTAQGRCDGVAIARGAGADIAGGILSLVAAAAGSFMLFVFAQGARMVARGLAQYRRPGPTGGAPAPSLTKIARAGLPFAAQGFVQQVAQYGDRFFVGVLYGTAGAGVVALGTNVALPIVMLGSTSATWLLPLLVREKGSPAAERVGGTLRRLLVAIVGCCLCAPAVTLAVPSARTEIATVVAAFTMLAFMGLINPAVSPLLASGRGWWASACTAGAIGVVVLALAGDRVFDYGLSAAVMLASVGLLLPLGFAVRFGVQQGRAVLYAAMAATLAACVGVAWVSPAIVRTDAGLWLALAVGLGVLAAGAWPSLRARLT